MVQTNAYGVANLTRNQKQIWLAQQLLQNDPLYNLAIPLNIAGAIDVAHYQNAFRTLLNSSDALRMVFQEIDGVPMQRTTPLVSFQLPYLDFSLSADPREMARQWMHERAKVPFDLVTRLWDSALIKLSATDFVWYLNTHHLVSDAWSIQRMYQLMAEFYQLSRLGQLPETIGLSCFQDYVTHERTTEGSSRRAKAESYWKQKLEARNSPLRFHGQAAIKKGPEVIRRSCDLGRERSQLLREVLRRTDTSNGSKDVSVLNAFCVLLCIYLERIHQNQEFFIGIASHNRRKKSFKQTIGFFSEVLPIRAPIGESDTFWSLYEKVNSEILETVRHGDCALANPVHKQIYDAVLNYHNTAFNEFAGMPAEPEWLHTGHGFESLTLQVHDFAAAGKLVVDFDFHADVFDSEQVELAVEHFLAVFDACLTDPAQTILETNLLSAVDENRLLVQWNDTAESGPAERCVSGLFEDQVRRTPDATAVILDGQRLSYTGLNRRANRLARYLRNSGIGPETVVGIYAGRSFEMLVSFLGILKAGGAFLPLDPSWPRDRSAFILKEAQVPLLITQRPLMERLPQSDSRIVCLDSDWESISQESGDDFPNVVSTSQLAYVIYTSGSSGKPRGVQITHEALLNFTSWASAAYDLGPGDRVLQFSSFSFDAAIEEVFPSLTTGAAVVLRTDAMLESVPIFLERCRDWKVTVLDLPTGYWHQLTTRLYRGGLSLPGTVRLLIIGGERASPERLLEWQKCVGLRCRLVNTYGPTEATVVATAYDLTKTAQSDRAFGPVPIGRPIANVRAYVLDKYLSPVPVGAVGELYIGGLGLARRYVNQPDWNAAKFIDHSFANGLRERLYRTGDLVRYRQDGNLVFLGRSDRQIKILGYRVEVEEIETVLINYPGVRDAVVSPHETKTNGASLTAYVIPKTGANPTIPELRAYLERKLPHYMIPGAILFMDSWPLTASGKIDRSALPPPSTISSQRDETSSWARTPIEKALADVWGEILGLQRINIFDSFFELGGHSLMATQVMSRIRHDFKVDLPLRALFQTPTIAGLSSQIQQALQNADGVVERPAILPVSREQELPLSFAQIRMWFMHRLAPQSSAYNLAGALRLRGKLNQEALGRSLDEIVRRHESIRTVFPAVDGQPKQVITAWEPVTLQYVDLREVPADQRLKEAQKVVTEQARRPFDLERDLLIRNLLVRLDEDDHILAFTMHHIASDQWSLGIIARELTHLYNSFCNGVEPQIGPLPVQYADFAVWQREWSKSEALEQQLAYWKGRLEGIQPLRLPTDRPRPALQSFNGAYIRWDFSQSLIDALKRLSLNEGATLYMTLLAAFKVLLFRYSGQTDIAIGSPIANRNWVQLEGIVGTFVNTMVLRTDLSGDPSVRELLNRVREATLEAYAHQETPFERVVEELQPERDTSLSPLVQVLFNFQNAPLGDFHLQDVAWDPFEFDIGASQFDLCLGVDPDILSRVVLTYNPDLFDRERMVRMMGHFIRLLEDIVTMPEKQISRLSLLSQAEEEQLLEDWNSTQVDFPHDACTHELFEAQVERTPDAIAVMSQGKKTTYRELNRRANCLAHTLRSMGIGCETPVGIFMGRSLEMIVSLLAIMKAGGAYVPLDPDYPSKRIAMMLEDSRAPVLLTHERLLRNLPETSAQVFCLDRDQRLIARQSDKNSPSGVSGNNLAYVIYTSGSTGRPKGVEISHRALVNLLLSMRLEPGLTDRDIMLSVTSLSFDIAALEIFLPLIVGGCVALISNEAAVDGRQLKEELDRSGATVLQATPMTWRLLLEAGWAGRSELKILCGGEALPRDLANALMQRSSSVWNLYGPTETTVWSTAYKVTSGAGPVAIGRPIANTQIYILDGNLQPVPIGVIGEIYIGGDGLARGYRGSPEQNQEKFVSNPFGGRGCVFKTGDLARYLSSGDIEYIGRTDSQLKLRGRRIELGEIESVLAEYPTVKQCVIELKQDPLGERHLVAYVVPQGDDGVNVSDLQKHLKEKLPNYMIPPFFMPMQFLPLTPNGKVDRQSLALPDFSAAAPEDGYVAPRDRVERKLTKLWQKTINVRGVGIKDNFFEVGGHSLLAMRLIARIEKDFGRRVPLAAVFEKPTIEKLADLLRDEEKTRIWNWLVPLQPGGAKPPFYLLHGSRELANQIGADQPVYGARPHGMDGRRAPSKVEEMAAEYLTEIRMLQPHGPYFIGGYSLGGLLAFEVAQQLKEQHQEVALVVMLDPTLPDAAGSGSSSFVLTAKAVNRFDGETSERLDWRLDEVTGRVKMLACKAMLSLGQSVPARFRKFYFIRAGRQAAQNYIPKIYNGSVIILSPENTARNQTSYWSPLVGLNLLVYKMPGGHFEAIKGAHVKAWAEQLRACLRNG